MQTTNNKMQIEIWSDIMCPFCYIGKRHFESALKQFNNKDNIEVIWKSYQLDSSFPESSNGEHNVYQYLASRKRISYEQSVMMHNNIVEMAKQAGLEYNFDKAIMVNSFKAHCIIQKAKELTLGDVAEEVFFKAYFTDGKNIGNNEVLISLGKQIGLSETQVLEGLNNDKYGYKVKQDIQEAEQIGVSGVPFFVFNRKYGVSGAQPVEVFIETLHKSFEDWESAQPEVKIDGFSGNSCSIDGECH